MLDEVRQRGWKNSAAQETLLSGEYDRRNAILKLNDTSVVPTAY
ncbi:MAG: hypothetical protein ACLTR6_04840 [Clostridium fessum]